MPSELRSLRLVLVVTGLLLGLAACKDEAKQASAPPSRFAAVTRDSSDRAARAFCEQTFPKAGEGAKKLTRPKEKPAPAHRHPKAPDGAWTWVNLWATWCTPCVKEMPLLDRWREALSKDGLPLAVELWSVDDDEAALAAWLKEHEMPGEVRWLEGGAALGEALTSFGLDPSAPIPVHVLVDPEGNVRCTRVGAVHDEDYGAVKALLSSR